MTAYAFIYGYRDSFATVGLAANGEANCSQPLRIANGRQGEHRLRKTLLVFVGHFKL